MEKEPGRLASAPPPRGVRERAPPQCRSSTESSGEPEPGPIASSRERARLRAVWQRQQIELERGYHAEAATAATQSPEQIGLVPAIDGDLFAAGGDQLDRGHPVAGESVLAMRA